MGPTFYIFPPITTDIRACSAFRPSGYLASVKNSEFLLGSEGPFCLTQAYARELAHAVLAVPLSVRS